MNWFGEFAQSVWENDLGSPSGITVTSISGWAETHLGEINIKINSRFCIDISGENGPSGSVYPAFGNTEEEIYKNLYLADFYEKRIRDASNGIFDGNSTINWTSLKEGDSSITRVNTVELIKTFRGLRKDVREELDDLCRKYKMNLSQPRQVVGEEWTDAEPFVRNRYNRI